MGMTADRESFAADLIAAIGRLADMIAAVFLVESGGERRPEEGVVGVLLAGVGVARPSCEEGGVAAADMGGRNSAARMVRRRVFASALGLSTDKMCEGADDADADDTDGSPCRSTAINAGSLASEPPTTETHG